MKPGAQTGIRHKNLNHISSVKYMQNNQYQEQMQLFAYKKRKVWGTTCNTNDQAAPSHCWEPSSFF